MLVILMLASGCSTKKTTPAPSASLYQPPTLSLPAGQPVQTLLGIYIPQSPETWHSPRTLEDLESLLIRERRAFRSNGYVPLPPVPKEEAPKGKQPIPAITSLPPLGTNEIVIITDATPFAFY